MAMMKCYKKEPLPKVDTSVSLLRKEVDFSKTETAFLREVEYEGALAKYEKNKKPRGFSRSAIFRAKKNIRLLVENNLSKYNYLVTLTYAGENPDFKKAQESFRMLQRRLKRICKGEYKMIGVPEKGELHGRLHWHCIIMGDRIDYKLFQNKVWTYGNANIKLFKNTRRDDTVGKVSNYVIKYITKDDARIEGQTQVYYATLNLKRDMKVCHMSHLDMTQMLERAERLESYGLCKVNKKQIVIEETGQKAIVASITVPTNRPDVIEELEKYEKSYWITQIGRKDKKFKKLYEFSEAMFSCAENILTGKPLKKVNEELCRTFCNLHKESLFGDFFVMFEKFIKSSGSMPQATYFERPDAMQKFITGDWTDFKEPAFSHKMEIRQNVDISQLARETLDE